MSKYSESDFVYPAIIALGKNSGEMSTTELISVLTEMLQPDGEDVDIISGRSDTYFSQKVRNLKAHKTLEKLGFAKVTDDGWALTEKGNNLYAQMRKMLSQYTSKPFQINGISDSYRPYITAIRTKPFLLLAGISGTGKSRIVRELARACWGKDHEESKAHKPRNYEIVQVKPNWHDSTELIGYVSRSSGTPVFVVGDFLKFVVKAWEEPDVPYFLCLDEMNLAPVEQYFAEFLSVIESRKLYPDGKIETDPILKPDFEGINVEDGTPILSKWYENLIGQLLSECPAEKLFALKDQFEIAGISIPQNLIVIGTVNMDETTFSFSRKVLDRAMTIEMNEVDLYGGLAEKHETIGKIEFKTVVGDAVEGVDVYETNKDVCDIVIEYLKTVNDKLEGTPFKIAYRTRNEFLLYVVNNLPYNKDDNNEELSQEDIINRALDEITCMKILPRIEGDVDKTSGVLNGLEDVLKGRFNEQDSASLKKIKEMKNRLQSGFTSFWS